MGAGIKIQIFMLEQQIILPIEPFFQAPVFPFNDLNHFRSKIKYYFLKYKYKNFMNQI